MSFLSGDDLPAAKSDTTPKPAAVSADRWWAAADYNAVRSAMLEMRDPVNGVVRRVVDSAIPQYALVKPSATAGHITLWLHTDSPFLVTGIAMIAATTIGQTIAVLETQGIQSPMLSDGTTTISAGDLVQPSTTVDGRIMKGSANPIGVATSAAAATLDTQVEVL